MQQPHSRLLPSFPLPTNLVSRHMPRDSEEGIPQLGKTRTQILLNHAPQQCLELAGVNRYIFLLPFALHRAFGSRLFRASTPPSLPEAPGVRRTAFILRNILGRHFSLFRLSRFLGRNLGRNALRGMGRW
eukprot:1323367-Amorphochlora_amoeboformis.AAC.1